MSPVLHGRRKSFWARVIVETAVASIGIALLSCALIANQRFLDRHFVPSFFLPRHWYVVLPTSGRVAVGGRRTTPSTRPATWLDVGTGADWTQEHRRSDHRLLHRSRRISG